MKLASLKLGRDGALVVISSDGCRYASAAKIAPTLREALDDWPQAEGRLRELADAASRGDVETAPVAGESFAAPLPRASGWLDGSTFVNHIELMHRSIGKVMGPEMTESPVMYQGGSDDFMGANDDIVVADESWGIDLEAELGVIVDDVPMGTDAASALKHVKLAVLINDVSLRNLQPRELALGFGMLQAKPSTTFGPFAVTPDELGEAWREGQLDLNMRSEINGQPLGSLRSTGMLYNFGQLIAHASRSRRLCAGTIIGSGTVSNAQPVETAFVIEGGGGFSCLSEARAIDTIRTGSPRTSFLKFGDQVRIEAFDANGQSVFGAIEQRVARLDNGQERSAA